MTAPVWTDAVVDASHHEAAPQLTYFSSKPQDIGFEHPVAKHCWPPPA
jgi:hypothetical protein